MNEAEGLYIVAAGFDTIFLNRQSFYIFESDHCPSKPVMLVRPAVIPSPHGSCARATRSNAFQHQSALQGLQLLIQRLSVYALHCASGIVSAGIETETETATIAPTNPPLSPQGHNCRGSSR